LSPAKPPGGFSSRKARAWTLTLLLFAAGGLTTANSAAAAEAGHVTRLRGEASVTSAGAKHDLSEGAALMEGDRITTGHDTRLELTLGDGTVVKLGDDSDLTIDAFLYDPAANKGNAALRLTAGVFRAVSGGIAKLPGEPLRVTTPVATIGIRGTDFWGRQTERTLLLALLGGRAVFVETKAGHVEVTQQNFATQVSAPGAAPSAPFALNADQLKAALASVAF
jgi:hypothetical protein